MDTKAKPKRRRADEIGPQRQEYQKNRQKILKSQDVCAICGQPVDKTLKYPHPYSASVDHIIPLEKGGHPSAMSNLQLAHFRCNRLKSDNLPNSAMPQQKKDEAEQVPPSEKKLFSW